MAFDDTQLAYRDLRDIFAERTDRIVAWVGAGLSQPAGLPSWPGLRSQLVSELKSLSDQQNDPNERSELFFAATEAHNANNLWEAFSLLENKLGNTTFRAVIRGATRASDKKRVPDAYRKLWEIGVSGIINLNIDRFAKRAFSETNPGSPLHDFTSNVIGSHVHVLKSPLHWIAQMHGEVDNSESWVFTSTALKA